MFKILKTLKKKSVKMFLFILFASIISFFIISDFPLIKETSKDTNFISPDSNIKVSSEESIIESLNKQSKLIVLETDLKETITLNDSYFDINLFKKIQTIEYFGKGYMSIDLSNISKDDIKINNHKKSLTIYISKPCVQSVCLDREKTKYLNVDNGLLRFGEIKLSPREFSKLECILIDSMKDKLLTDPNIYNESCNNAKKCIEKLLCGILPSDNTLNLEFV